MLNGSGSSSSSAGHVSSWHHGEPRTLEEYRALFPKLFDDLTEWYAVNTRGGKLATCPHLFFTNRRNSSKITGPRRDPIQDAREVFDPGGAYVNDAVRSFDLAFDEKGYRLPGDFSKAFPRAAPDDEVHQACLVFQRHEH